MSASASASESVTSAATSTAASAPQRIRVGVILGSARVNGNSAGLLNWIQNRFHTILKQLPEGNAIRAAVDAASPQIVLLQPETVLGPVVDGLRMPAQHDRANLEYSSAAVQKWSEAVRATSAVIFLSPQFNWGIPGELKNSIDHLYWEWRARPAAIVTYGGHGGGKCADALRLVCEGGLKMAVLPVDTDVRITLPRTHIEGAARVENQEAGAPLSENNQFLTQYNDALDKMLTQLLTAIVSPPKEAAAAERRRA